MFIKLNKQLLNKSLTKAGVTDKIIAVRVIEIFEECVVKFLGKQVLRYINPLYVKNKVLVVRVVDSLIAAELKKQEQDIINFINNKINSSSVKKLRFVI